MDYEYMTEKYECINPRISELTNDYCDAVRKLFESFKIKGNVEVNVKITLKG